MPDNSTLPATGDVIAADEIGGVKFQRIKLVLGADGVNAGDVASGNPMPVQASSLPLPTGAATETTLAAVNAKLPTLSSGRVPVELPAGGAGLTNSELRATAVPVSGTFFQATQPVSLASWAGLTDTQLRATAVPVSFTWSGLTDAQLRAAALALPANAATETTLAAVSAKLPALSGGRIPVELPAGGGGLTNSELRAAPVPIDATGELIEAIQAMRMAVQALIRTIGQTLPDTAARMRVNIEAGTLPAVTTVSTVTTVTSLTNQAQIGGLSATEQIPSLMRLGADSMRRNISVT